MVLPIKEQLEEAEMPIFWQFYALFHAFLVTITFLFANDFWRFVLYPIIGLLIIIGLSSGIFRQVLMRKNWYFLIIGVVFIEISIILESLINFGISVNFNTVVYLKELGVAFAALFVLLAMLFIEKKFKLRGFLLDFGLVTISSIVFIFIVKPDYLNKFIFEFNIAQQFLLFNIALGLFLIIIGLLHFAFSKDYEIKDFILITIIGSFLSHFTIELLTSFEDFNNPLFASKTSWFFFQIIGSLSIFYSYLERFELKYSLRANSKISYLFMWLASILAILTVPVATLINGFDEKTPTFHLATNIASLILGSIVIWRLIILVSNSHRQRLKLINLAHTDEMTGILNYIGYCEKYSRSSITNCLVVAMDIDDFKSINDLYGRTFGDKVLKKIATRLSLLKTVKLVSRVGPDNFVIIFQVPKNKIKDQLKLLESELGVWQIIEDRRIAVPLTFGASHSTKITNIEVLTRQAEKALKIARNKRISFALYTDDDNDKLVPRHEIRGLLQQALDKNFLPVHFQPIYDLNDGSLKAIELLIRVQSPQHGLLLPSQFLDQARSYGLLTQLTKVCIKMIAYNYKHLPKVIININLPPYMIENPRILNDFLMAFKEANLSPNRFCIEVTEDEDIPAEHLLESVQLLKKVGFSIAMDDFGTGYSSLSRLSMLPFDTVKIDRSILLAATSGNKAILESTITLIKRLGLSVVVEGVETLEQLKLIRQLGAHSVQGFLLSKPTDVTNTIKLPLNAANIIAEF